MWLEEDEEKVVQKQLGSEILVAERPPKRGSASRSLFTMLQLKPMNDMKLFSFKVEKRCGVPFLTELRKIRNYCNIFGQTSGAAWSNRQFWHSLIGRGHMQKVAWPVESLRSGTVARYRELLLG